MQYFFGGGRTQLPGMHIYAINVHIVYTVYMGKGLHRDNNFE